MDRGWKIYLSYSRDMQSLQATVEVFQRVGPNNV